MRIVCPSLKKNEANLARRVKQIKNLSQNSPSLYVIIVQIGWGPE
jgi:hypothetical protein